MMEGGGEGVVAVVRWLADAGLAVGFLSSTRPRRPVDERALRESSGRASPRRARCEQRGSQTFPEREHERAICPEPYASTYQVAHCGVGAGSTAHWHTEFPPQRRTPSPALGNFEVTHRSRSPAHSDVHSCRFDKDSGWQYRPQQDRDVDAFVSSLRKYPSVTERTPSADLLERLLKTSHALSPKESPPPSKKRRHHWDKPQALAPLSLYANRQRDRRDHRKPGQAQSDLRQKTYGPEKYPLPGPMSITAFDYLSSGKPSPKIPEKTPNRHVKNAFREAHREKRPVTAFPVCPILRSRFEKHLKQCHPTTSKALYEEFTSPEACSKCLLKKPCLCEATKRLRRVVDKKEQEKRVLEDVIFTWLKDIPIYPNEKPHDKFIRDAIVKKMAETLSGMPDSEFAIEGKEEIEKALKKMPMWYPTDQREREHFLNMMTDNLIEKIKSIKEMKAFNEAAEDFLNEITFGKEINKEQALSNIITELNKIALNRPEDDSTYRDLLKMKAFELLDPLPIKTFGNKYEYLNELSDQLAEHLVNPHLDQETKQIIKEDIKYILDHSHAYIKNRDKVEESLRNLVADIVIKGMDDDKAESLIRCLLDRNVSDDKIEGIKTRVLALADKVQPIHSKLGQKTKQIIKDYVRDMVDICGAQIKNRPKIEVGLQKIVHDVASKYMDEDKAVDLIKSLLKGKVSEHIQDDITNQILKLANQVKPLDTETKQMIKGDIRDILDTSGAKITDREKVEKTLNMIIHDVATTGMDTDKAKVLMKSLLKGKVSEEKFDDITDQILELANQVKPILLQPLDKETKQIIKGDIRDILNISGVKIKDRETIEKTLNSIIHDVATTGMDEDKAEALIKSLLKGKVSEDKHDDITNQVLELANQVKPPEIQPLDKETTQMIKGDIRDVLDFSGAKIKDREKIEKTLNTIVRDVATNGMDESKTEAMVKSLLQGKISDDKYDDIKDKILTLANQVKPSQAQPVDKETKQMIKGDIRDILDMTGAPIKNREKIEKTLNTIVHDVVSKGLDENNVEAIVKSLLKGKVSEDKQDEITDQILSLANQVKPPEVQPLDKETQQLIKGDIHDVLDISGVKIKDRQKIEKSLNKIVHDVATKGINEDKVEAMVKSLLKGKVSEDKHDDIIDQILSLANQVKPPEVQPLDKETQQLIKGDIHDVLDLSGANIMDREKIEKTLNTIVRDVATTGMDESKAEAMIKSLLKGKVSEEKYVDIKDKILTLANQVKPSQAQPVDKETKQMIKDDIHDMLDIPGAKIKDREKIENSLNKIVHDVATNDIDVDKVEAMVKSLLKGKVLEDKHDDIIDQILSLANQVKPIQIQPLNKEIKQIIKDDIHDVLDIPGAKIKDREKIEKSLNKIVQDVATKGIDEDKIEAMVKSLLKGKISEDQHDDIIDQILSLANQVKLPEVQPLDKETQQLIKGDIHDVLDLSGANIMDREKIEKTLNTIVRDVATTGMDKSKAEAMIKSLLKGKVSDGKYDDIKDQILSLANQVQLSQAQPMDNETKQMIKDDIHDVLDTTGGPIKNREIIEKTLNTIVHDVVSKGLDEDKVEAMVKSLLKGKVSEHKQDEITDQILSLISQVKPIQVQPLEKETKQMIKDDIHDVLDISGVKIKDREKIEKSLNKIVHDVATKAIDEDKVEAMVKSLLKGKVSEDKHDDIIDQILSLANQVKPPEVQPLDKETQQLIKGDIHDVLDLSVANIMDREKIEKTLNTIVRDVATTGMDESKAEAMIKSLLKGKVSEEKYVDIKDKILTLANQVKPSQAQPVDKETKQMIKDDIHDVLDIPGAKIKDREKIEKSLNKIVQDVATKGIDEDKVEGMVKSLLTGKVSEDKHDDIIDHILSLANQVKPPEVQPLDKETQQLIKGDIHDVLDISGVKIKDREKIEKSLNKIVHDVATKGIHEDKVEAMVKSLLKGKVSEDKHDDIIDQILSLANQVKPPEVQPLDKETQQLIKGDIHDVLDLSGANIMDREKIEKTLNTIVRDVATTGMDESKAEAMIKSLLKGKVSEEKYVDIKDKILTLANQVKPSQAQPVDKETKQMIKDDIHDMLDIPGAKIKDREKIENSLNKIVHDVATNDIDVDKVEAMVKSLLKGKVLEDKHDDIIDQILSLANQVKPPEVQPLDKETQQLIKGDIHDVLDISGVKIKDREKIEKSLNKIVHDVATKGINEDKVEAMVKSSLKGKVSEDKHDDIIDQILSLANQLKPPEVQPLDKETQQLIKGDIHDVLDLSGANIMDREKIEKTLNTIVRDVATTGMDESKAEAMIKSLLKGKVSEEKYVDIKDKILTLANQVKPSQAQPVDKETKQMIKDDIHDMLDIPGAKIKDREKIENSLNKIVHDVATNDIDVDKVEAMVKSLLKGKVLEDKHDDIIDQILSLANQVKPIQIQPLNKEIKQIIKDDIHHVLDIPGAKIKDREKIEKSLNKIVQDVATKGIDEDKIEAMVKSLLKGKVSEDKHDDIIDQILSLANQVKPSSSKQLDLDTKQIMKKDINDILNESKSHIKNQSQVEENVLNLIFSMLSTSIGKGQAKSRLKSILKGKVSDDEVGNISSKFLELANKMKATQTMHDTNFQEALKNDITDILLETDAPIKYRSKVEENLRDILSDIVMRGMDKSRAQDYIHSALEGNVSDSQAEEISKKILALAEQRSLRLSQDSSGPLASSTQNEEKLYYDRVYGTIRDWLKNMNIALKYGQIHKVAEAIANETLDRQKYLQLNPAVKISEKNESEILKEQIYKALNKLVDKKTVQSIMTYTDDLMHSLKEIPPLQDSSIGLVQDSIEFVQENLEGALLSWLRDSPIYQSRYPKNKESQKQMMSKLAKTLAAVLSSPAMTKPGANTDKALLKEIIKQLEEFPLQSQFKSNDYIRKLGGHLLDYLKSLQLFQDISARSSLKDSHRTNTSLMPTTNHLNDIVNDWCAAIPLPSTDESFRIQQDLANKIILKIGELNMNQDIFNDDSLYEEELQDFIDQQANLLEISQYVTEDHKRVLTDQIKQVKQKVQDDLVGRAYKQQLRDTVSKTLPSTSCPTVEDLASFELMKENLADAFINLNYSGEDEELRAKYKRKIIDEVNKYVNDYLRCCPAPPVTAKKLNEDLYKALVNVPVPGDESMRSEVETVRMKDVINDWLKTIPMNKQSKAELLRTNKIITLMAQKLQELESEFHPEFEDTAVEEIVTYLKKLPLKSKNNLDGMAKKLVEKIKNTAESRSFIEGTRSKLADDCLCKDLPVPPLPARASNQSCVSFIPPCGLSKEDQELLQKIRERSLLCETATQLRNRIDAAVNPPPSDRGSQTEMPCQSKCCQHADRSESACSKFLSPSKCPHAEKSEPICSRFFNPKTKRVPVSTRPCTSTRNQADASPFVLVKEYYLDSPSRNKVEFATQTPVEESGRICIPSSPVSPEGICRSRECITRRPIRPRSHLDASSCRRATPRRQFTSACPNEYFSRPKPHNCLKSGPVPERDYLRSQCRRVGANRPRRKSSCLSCQDPTRMCPDCFPMHVCPHPTCLYFK